MRTFSRALCLLAVAGLSLSLSACGGRGLSSGTIRLINVEVNGDSVDLYEATHEAVFSQAVQSNIQMPVIVSNQGTAAVTLSGINWASDTDGSPLVNQYISLNWGSGVTFPHRLEVGEELKFYVVYSPPYDTALDDFSPSVLILESNAMVDGATAVPVVTMTFNVPSKRGAPEISPPNFEFETATPTSPGEHTFTVYNDCEVGTDSFEVLEISMESPTNEFKVVSIDPYLPFVVDAGACDPVLGGVLQFTVRYTPADSGNDSNAVLVKVDGIDAAYRVPLDSDVVLGNWSLSYGHLQELDFSTSTTVETRSVLLSSDGPGTLQVKEPWVDDEAAAEIFQWTAFIPTTSPDASDTLIGTWPRGLQAGKTIRFDVTYTPPTVNELGEAVAPSNGQMFIPIKMPDQEIAVLDLFAGEPKGRLVTAPATNVVSVTGAAQDKGNPCDDSMPCSKPELCTGGTCGADSGTRNVVLYNEGNGPLTIDSLVVKTTFGPPKNFSLVDAPVTPFDIAPNDLVLLTIGWDTKDLADLEEGESETLEINYVDPYTETVVPQVMGLYLLDNRSLIQPEAVITLPEGPYVANEKLYVSANASYGGEYELASQSYVWYLVDKPAGSKTRLNEDEGVTQSLTPDRPGDYVIELLVVPNDGGSKFLVSPPVQATLTVGE